MHKLPSVFIADLVTLARERMDQSVSIAKRADSSAEDGNVDDAVSAIMGIEQLLWLPLLPRSSIIIQYSAKPK